MSETTDIIPASTTPSDLISQAINKDLDIEKLERLLAMKERWDKEQARKAFFKALADFQDECPELRKTKPVRFKDDGPVIYWYAPLADIERQIKKLLKKCGLTKSWKFFDNAGKTKVVCHLTHIDGHTEQTEMESDSDMSGAKNAIQGKGSAIEFMKRYTLIGALGLSTADSDIDGRQGDYETDVDKLHGTFMEAYNQVIQIDPALNKWNPDNWLVERTGKNYIKAIGEIRKVLFDLQKKKA
jgi:hypothetical protein